MARTLSQILALELAPSKIPQFVADFNRLIQTTWRWEDRISIKEAWYRVHGQKRNFPLKVVPGIQQQSNVREHESELYICGYKWRV